VNFNAGCKSAVSNIVMATAVMITLLFLTPLFHYTPLVVLSSIIITAMLGLIDYEAVIHLWKIDKFDCMVCMGAYVGVVFGSVEIGLVIAVNHFSEEKENVNFFLLPGLKLHVYRVFMCKLCRLHYLC
jgi:sulfate transporter 3